MSAGDFQFPVLHDTLMRYAHLRAFVHDLDLIGWAFGACPSTPRAS